MEYCRRCNCMRSRVFSIMISVIIAIVFISVLTDDAIEVIIEQMERNKGLIIQYVQDVKYKDELVSLLVILKPDIPDFRDFLHYKLVSALEGHVLLLKQPTIPHFLLHEPDIL
eukprot:6690691-Ditylum_brightwellii.AAC.1